MIEFLVWLVVLAIIATCLIFLVRYIGAPAILEKIIVVVTVLIMLIEALRVFGIYSWHGMPNP